MCPGALPNTQSVKKQATFPFQLVVLDMQKKDPNVHHP